MDEHKEQTKRAHNDVELSFGVLTDDLRALADRIGRDTGGREMSLAITRLQEAQMWADLAAKLRGE